MKKVLLSIALILLLVLAAYFMVSKHKIAPPVFAGPPSPTGNKSQVVRTAYMVVSPAAVKGDTIVFQAFSPSGAQIHIRFPLGSPCDETDLPGSGSNPPRCVVTKDVKPGTKAQYVYYVDSNEDPPEDKQPLCPGCPVTKGVCTKCCQGGGCKIVILNPVPGQPQIQFGKTGTGPNPAIEILIDQTEDGALTAHTATPVRNQLVTWYRSGTDDAQWAVTFDDSNACKEGKDFTNVDNQNETCTVIGSENKYYRYTMHTLAGKKIGTGLLYVNPTPEELPIK